MNTCWYMTLHLFYYSFTVRPKKLHLSNTLTQHYSDTPICCLVVESTWRGSSFAGSIPTNPATIARCSANCAQIATPIASQPPLCCCKNDTCDPDLQAKCLPTKRSDQGSSLWLGSQHPPQVPLAPFLNDQTLHKYIDIPKQLRLLRACTLNASIRDRAFELGSQNPHQVPLEPFPELPNSRQVHGNIAYVSYSDNYSVWKCTLSDMIYMCTAHASALRLSISRVWKVNALLSGREATKSYENDSNFDQNL